MKKNIEDIRNPRRRQGGKVTYTDEYLGRFKVERTLLCNILRDYTLFNITT
jgi:hypothetical protein